MNAAAALIKALEDLGVTQVFGLPGVQNIEIYDALLDSGINHVLVRHEQAAVHMADAYARVTGRVGVVFATSGPGATNTVTGIATAYMDSIPVIVITGQVHTTAIGTDAFQEADITTITLPITKHSYLLKDAKELLPAVFEAFYLASSGRPGPVLIDIPGNVAAAELDYVPLSLHPSIPSYKPTVRGNAKQVKAAAELLMKAQNPVLLAGGGVVSSGASEVLVELAKRCNMPVVTTLQAKGVTGVGHPLYLGQPGVYGLPRANNALQAADVVLAVGTRFSERVTGNASEFAPEAKIIHVDIDPAEIGKNIRVDVPIVGDAATVLHDLLKRIEPNEGGAGTGQVSLGKTSNPTDKTNTWTAELASNTTHSVFLTLNRLLKEHEGSIVTTDVGQHQLWASHVLDRDKPRHFLTSGGLGTMGFGLPAALGAQLAEPGSLVLCVSGDGSFQMNLQEMAIAQIHKLPIKVAIINNSSLGLVRQWQELYLDHRYAHTLLDEVPNYVSLAEAYGWQGRSCNVADASNGQINSVLEEDLRWLLEGKGPQLLEVRVPTGDLLLPMVRPGGSLTEMI